MGVNRVENVEYVDWGAGGGIRQDCQDLGAASHLSHSSYLSYSSRPLPPARLLAVEIGRTWRGV